MSIRDISYCPECGSQQWSLNPRTNLWGCSGCQSEHRQSDRRVEYVMDNADRLRLIAIISGAMPHCELALAPEGVQRHMRHDDKHVHLPAD